MPLHLPASWALLGAALTALRLAGCGVEGPRGDAPCIAALHDASKCRGYANDQGGRDCCYGSHRRRRGGGGGFSCADGYQKVWGDELCPVGSDWFSPGEEGTFEFCCYPAETELGTLGSLYSGCTAGNGIMPGDRGTCGHGEQRSTQDSACSCQAWARAFSTESCEVVFNFRAADGHCTAEGRADRAAAYVPTGYVHGYAGCAGPGSYAGPQDSCQSANSSTSERP